MAVLFRAVVMLGVLVGLPAAWVYYGPLPEGGQKLVDRVVRAVQEAISPGDQSPLAQPIDHAPRFNPAVENVSSSTISPEVTAEASSDWTKQIEPLLAQLRQQGVTEYQLNRWGRDGAYYRFHCQMPLADSDDLTRQFEAVAEDPITSVRQVIDEVGSWQLARLDKHSLR